MLLCTETFLRQINLISSFVVVVVVVCDNLLRTATIFPCRTQPNVTWEVSGVCRCECGSICIPQTLHAPRDSVRARAQRTWNVQKKYYDKLSANLHLPEETFTLFATQTHFNFISVVLRTLLQLRERESEYMSVLCFGGEVAWVQMVYKSVITIVLRLQVNQRRRVTTETNGDTEATHEQLNIKNMSKTSKKKTIQTFLAIKWLRVWIKNEKDGAKTSAPSRWNVISGLLCFCFCAWMFQQATAFKQNEKRTKNVDSHQFECNNWEMETS